VHREWGGVITAGKPLVIIVATAADPSGNYLPQLAKERREIRAGLQSAKDKGLCELVLEADATATSLFDVLQEYGDRVGILHFAGHANSQEILLDSQDCSRETVSAGGLATFLGQQCGLQFVFLNACSTYGHVNALHRAGISTVIATSRSIKDDVACDFASRFYKGLGAGSTVEVAFKQAASAIQATRKDPRYLTRPIEPDPSGPDISREGWPWDLHVSVTGAGDWGRV